METTKPSKEQLREYLHGRHQHEASPPPTPEEIRRMLGWFLRTEEPAR